MKIALFTETYLPYINGVVTHVHSLRLGLEKLGHQVLVVCGESGHRRHFLQDGVLYCPGRPTKRFYGYALAKPFSATRKKLISSFHPDVIHVHTEFGVGISGVEIAKDLKIPLVYTLHTMYDDYIYYVAPKPFINLVKKASHGYFKYFMKNAHCITGPSKKCQEYADKIGVHKQVTVIPNPVELEMFDPLRVKQEDKDGLLEKHGLGKELTLACFVGRLGKEKSTDLLLHYWQQTVKPQDGLRLLIIGEGPEKPALEKLAEKLGIGDMVIFVGKIQHQELPPYYGVCKLYITASLSDTNSISMLEAMAFGLPVLQRLDRLNEDQVIEGVNGFVYDSPPEFKAKLEKIQAMTEEARAELGALVRSSVGHKGYEALAARVLTVYEEAIGLNPPLRMGRKMNPFPKKRITTGAKGKTVKARSYQEVKQQGESKKR